MGRFVSVQTAHLGLESIDDGVLCLSGAQHRAVLEVGSVNFASQGEVEQEATVAGFAAFLNGLSFPVQILMRAVPIDLQAYLVELEHRALQYPENLAELARDHAAFLRRLARSRTLLERRFYLVVPAQQGSRRAAYPLGWPFGRKLPGPDATAAGKHLTFRCEEIARQLGRCGLTARRLSSVELAQLLYDCWCPELARVQRVRRDLVGYTSLIIEGPRTEVPGLGDPRGVSTRPPSPGSSARDKKEAVMPFISFRRRSNRQRRGLSAEERRLALGSRSLADLVAPAATELARDHLRLDYQYTRILVVTGYPRSVSPGWLSPLIDFEEPLEISLHLYPLDSGQMVQTLTQKMVQLHSSRLMAARGGHLADPEREVAYEDAERLRDALQRGEEKIFSVSLYLLLRANSLAALGDLTRRVEATLGGMLAQSRVALLEQDAGFRSCLPQGQDRLLVYRNLDTSSLATMFPFSSSTLSMERGILYGIAKHNHSPVLFDPFDESLENANMVVFAKSGAGKSYFTKLMALRNLLAGVDFLVIDPEDEYRTLCTAVGGQHLRLASSSGQRLNPFDLPPMVGDQGGRDALAEQVASLLGLLELMLAEPGESLNAHERAVLDRALYQTYAADGITEDSATHGRPVPILRDLHATLLSSPGEVAESLATRLRRYVEGSLAGLFSGSTNVALDRRFVVFDVQSLEPELRPLGIHLIASFVWNQVHRSRKPRLLIIDEAWSLMQYPQGGAFLSSMARRARKYYLGLVTITQDVADFLGCDHGRTLLANVAVKLLMKQDSATVDPVVAAFQLSTEERQFLLSASKGEGLFFARGNHVALQVEASPAEHRLATTAPRELAELALEGTNRANTETRIGARSGTPRRCLGCLPGEGET